MNGRLLPSLTHLRLQRRSKTFQGQGTAETFRGREVADHRGRQLSQDDINKACMITN